MPRPSTSISASTPEIVEAGATRMLTACSLVSAALGMVLLALWIEGPGYGLPVWVSWVDALAAVLAFVAAVAVSSGEMFSVPLWAVAGVGLCFAAGLGHNRHDGAWTTWVQLAMGLAFFAMTIVIGSAVPQRRRLARSCPQRRTSRRVNVTTGS